MKTSVVMLFGMAAILAGVDSSWAQAQAAGQAGQPKIALETNVYDFGKVISGEVVRHDFIFTNIGQATLEILSVHPACGCTTAGQWDKTIEPGKTGRIPLEFNSATFSGTVAKSATVTCNDPTQTNITLEFTGNLWKAIEVTPTMASFGIPKEHQTNETRVLRIVNNLEEPITLSEVQSGNASFKAKLKTVRPGKEFELHVTAVPPFNTPTAYGAITMKTSSSKMPTLSVTAYAMILQPVIVTPQQINLPAGPLANAFSPTVIIRNGETNVLALSDAKVEGATAEVRIQEVSPGRVFHLNVSFPAGLQLKPAQKTELKVKTNHPKVPLITIPVIQAPPPAAASVAQGDSSTGRVLPTRPAPSTTSGTAAQK